LYRAAAVELAAGSTSSGMKARRHGQNMPVCKGHRDAHQRFGEAEACYTHEGLMFW
jgi:hypothetical protein